MTGIEPAAASLDVARSKPGAASVTWLHGDATTLPALSADIAMMTGNVAQVFLNDDDWSATLRGIRGALRDSGHLVFETRRPEHRAWQEWAVETGPVIRNVPGIGVVEQHRAVTRVALPYVSFRYTHTFASDGLEVWSDSTLRFRSQAEVEQTLATNGFTTSTCERRRTGLDGSTSSWRNERPDRTGTARRTCAAGLPASGWTDRARVLAEEIGVHVDVQGVVVAAFDEPVQPLGDLVRVEVEAFAQVTVCADERLSDFLRFGAGDVVGVAEMSG